MLLQQIMLKEQTRNGDDMAEEALAATTELVFAVSHVIPF